MTNELQTALTLMAVGMITVFIILTFVVLGGKLLIAFTNRFITEEVKSKAPAVRRGGNEEHIAVLAAVTDHITGGKGKIERIEKIN